MFLYSNNNENYMYFDMRMVKLETDGMYGVIDFRMTDNISSYVVTVRTVNTDGFNSPFITKSFGNGVSAEDFLLKVLCNPTFYKIQYS